MQKSVNKKQQNVALCHILKVQHQIKNFQFLTFFFLIFGKIQDGATGRQQRGNP